MGGEQKNPEGSRGCNNTSNYILNCHDKISNLSFDIENFIIGFIDHNINLTILLSPKRIYLNILQTPDYNKNVTLIKISFMK